MAFGRVDEGENLGAAVGLVVVERHRDMLVFLGTMN